MKTYYFPGMLRHFANLIVKRAEQASHEDGMTILNQMRALSGADENVLAKPTTHIFKIGWRAISPPAQNSRHQRAEDQRDRGHDLEGSLRQPHHTKSAAEVVTVRGDAVVAISGATVERAEVPTAAANHAISAGDWALWVVAAG